jgi:hypothetical protein
MGTLGRENWGQAVGNEMLLANFEALIGLALGVYGRPGPAADAVGRGHQRLPARSS